MKKKMKSKSMLKNIAFSLMISIIIVSYTHFIIWNAFMVLLLKGSFNLPMLFIIFGITGGIGAYLFVKSVKKYSFMKITFSAFFIIISIALMAMIRLL